MKKTNEEEENLSNQETTDPMKEQLRQQMEAYQKAMDGIETPEETEELNRIAEEEAALAAHERRATLSEQEQEALRLGEELIARRKTKPIGKKKKRVYVAVAAVMVLSLSIGMTGFGEKFKWLQVGGKAVGNANITTVESEEDIIELEELEEKEAYESIDEAFGISVLRLMSEGTVFEYMDVDIFGGTKAELLYNYEGIIVMYSIVLDPTEVSHQEIVEDTLVEEYIILQEGVEITVRHYIEEDSGLEYMKAIYVVNEIFYSLKCRISEEEFMHISQNLFFY